MLLCGCATSHKVSVYTLQVPSYPDVQALAASGTSILLNPVTLPELVNRPQLVVHTDDHQVKIIESSRWAQTLKDEVGAVLAANLARDLGTLRVFLHAHEMPDEPQIRVVVNVLRFESRPGVAATIEALWTIRYTDSSVAITDRSMAVSYTHLSADRVHRPVVDAGHLCHNRPGCAGAPAIAGNHQGWTGCGSVWRSRGVDHARLQGVRSAPDMG